MTKISTVQFVEWGSVANVADYYDLVSIHSFVFNTDKSADQTTTNYNTAQTRADQTKTTHSNYPPQSTVTGRGREIRQKGVKRLTPVLAGVQLSTLSI